MSSKVVVVFAGPKRTGKSTSSIYLRRALLENPESGLASWDVEIMAFADPLKYICNKYFGYTSEQMWGNESDKTSGGPWDWSELRPLLKKSHDHKGTITGRDMLQILGTEVFRKEFCSHVWEKVAMLRMQASPAKVVIFQDARMPRECTFADGQYPVYRALLQRRTGLVDGHETENALYGDMPFQWSEVIDNNGTIDALYTKTLAISEKVLSLLRA